MPRCRKTQTTLVSCGFTIIVAQEPTESLSAAHFAFGWKERRLWSDDLVLKFLMISFVGVVNHELVDGSAPRAFPHQDHSVQTLFLHASHELLGTRIGMQGAWRQSHAADSERSCCSRPCGLRRASAFNQHPKPGKIVLTRWRRGWGSANDCGSTRTALSACR